MKKTLSIITLSFLALGASAQEKGRFETYEFDSFKLHVYYTNDTLGDASYIVEGKNALVTMEHPLFKDNVAEFDAYLVKLGKPVEQRIADYHVGGTADHEVAMPEGMPTFSKGEIYDGMMQDVLYTLDPGKGTCQPPSGLLSCRHRCGDCRKQDSGVIHLRSEKRIPRPSGRRWIGRLGESIV